MIKHWHKWRRLGKPAGWSHLHHIAVGKNLDGRLEVFGGGTDGKLYQIWQIAPNGDWSEWESRDNPAAGGIELAGRAVGKSLAVGRNQDGGLLVCVVAAREAWSICQTSPNNGWGPWQPLKEPPGSGGIVSLEVAQNSDGRLQLFATSYANRLASRQQTEPNGNWGEWDTRFPHDDSLTVKSFAVGQNEDGRLELVINLSGILALVTQDEPGGPFRSGFGNAGVTTPDAAGTLTMARNPDGTLAAATTIDGSAVLIEQRALNQLPSPGGGGWARRDLARPAEDITVRCPVLGTDRDGSLALFAQGSDGNLWYLAFNGDRRDWHSLRAPSDTGETFNSFDVGQNQNGLPQAFMVRGGELWCIGPTE